MTSRKAVANQANRSAPEQRTHNRALRPAVDIVENEQALHLYANLPGVPESNLSLEVDGDTLSIAGDVSIDMPDELQSLHADIRANRFQRVFTLSKELDSSRIEASLKNGVLAVTIPKREEVKPRRIDITVH